MALSSKIGGMAEPHVISALKAKEEEIKRRITSLKREIKESQEDLETVRKSLCIFEPTKRSGRKHLFRRGDIPRIVFDALRANPEGLDADQLAEIIAEKEGLDATNPEIATTIRQRCFGAMYRYSDKGKIVKTRRASVSVWRLAQ
jgi:hypothetical protein